ncbi:DPP IV N-terminal domain-containing protein [Puia sp. P3]|uniref:DPP IV N-terminal domain-containing protein n=1 Tax=Puia sp. P3 TaxID=3423952 RepID=UPI003D669091
MMAGICLLFIVAAAPFVVRAQISWNKDGNSYTTVENGAIVEVTLPAMTKSVVVGAGQLAPLGVSAHAAGGRRGGGDLEYSFSSDRSRVLLLAKPVREYHNTYHSAWVFDRKASLLLPIAQEHILNAKISPDGSRVAYVFRNNIYSVEIGSSVGSPVALTSDGSDKRLNGWFDYASSEELYCVDGFRWSPDSKSIAYWQNDLSRVGIFYMINNTDSIYPKIIAIPFSKVGEPIAQARIGVVSLATRATKWMNIEGDPSSHYLARMEWTPDGTRIITQQFNRAQNNSKLVLSNPGTGESKVIYNESDDAWIDLKAFWSHAGVMTGTGSRAERPFCG